VTWKGKRRDPNIFRSNYLENGWRYRLGYNKARIGNGTKVLNQIYLDANISKTVEDKGSVTMGHQQEMTYGGSIGHVTDDVT